MKKQNKNLIMFIGKTHSGKTSFAKELEKGNNDIIILELDPIALFMRENFPKLRELDDREHSGKFKNISLKYQTFILFVEFAMSFGRSIILSNSNMWIKGRGFIFKLAKKFNYKVIGVYFDFPEEFLLNRIKNSKRTTSVLRVSKSFEDLIIRQRTGMEIPNPNDFEEFYIVKSENDLEIIKNKLIKIL